MKIKNGFVSNSSTTSFLIPSKLSEGELADEIKNILESYGMITGKDIKFSETFIGPYDTGSVEDGEKVYELGVVGPVPFPIREMMSIFGDAVRNG